MPSSYSNLASHTVPQLLMFLSTWECKQGFSAFMNIKSKTWNHVGSPGHDFRCTVSKTALYIEELEEGKKLHSSH